MKNTLIIIFSALAIACYGGCSSGEVEEITAGSSALINPAGIKDTDFGASGVVTTAVLAPSSALNALGIQPDGKIVGGGSAYNGVNQFFTLARYTASGALDAAFGTAGVVTTTLTPGDACNSLAFQADGKIVAGGYGTVGGDNIIDLARYTITGALDAAFGINGIVTTTVGTSCSSSDVKIQADGKIILGGTSASGLDFVSVLVRYTASGALDLTFDTDGVVTSSVLTGFRAVEILHDGTILAAGGGNNKSIGLARYTITGTLDTAFGTNGVVTTTLGTGGNDDSAYDLALQDDGKILICGFTKGPAAEYYGVILRYNANGTLDTAFGTNGSVLIAIPTYTTVGYASIAVQADGKIVVGGFAGSAAVTKFLLARYNSNGTIDSAFGTNGIILELVGIQANGYALKIQADGKLVIGGYSSPDGVNFYFTLARYE
ncbi:MAG: hypothetical protein HY811_08385 [Planctomycetes bacterium]|nr:hypothetical protein [Planctomycetota bacterium]